VTELHALIDRLRQRSEDPEFQARLAEAEAAEKEKRMNWAAEVRRRALGETKMPTRVIDLIESGLQDTDPILAARSFLSSPRSLLVMAGGTGNGKTVAACAALAHYLRVDDDGYSMPTAERVGRFVKAMEIVRIGTFNEGFWRSLERSPLLVVDDVGTEPLDDKGWALANFAALIDSRYDSKAKTILTTNLTVDGFKARYAATDGGRLVDRLREAGAFLTFGGESMRRSDG
jgi:DNA replication protein DnaC